MTRDDILGELANMNILLGSRKSQQELTVITEAFYEDFGHIPLKYFQQILKRHRAISKFFPTPAHIRTEWDKLKNEFYGTQKQLEPPPQLSEKQRLYNLEQLAKIKKMLAEKNSMDGDK